MARLRRRRWSGAGWLRIQRVRELCADGMVGWLYIPPGRARRHVIIVLGGSGGGYDLDKAGLLSRHGFATLALAYFGVPPLPGMAAPCAARIFCPRDWRGSAPRRKLTRAALVCWASRAARNWRCCSVRGSRKFAPWWRTRRARLRGVQEAATKPPAKRYRAGCRTAEAIPFAPLPLRRFIARSAIPVGLLRRPVKFRNLFRSALRNRQAVKDGRRFLWSKRAGRFC